MTMPLAAQIAHTSPRAHVVGLYITTLSVRHSWVLARPIPPPEHPTYYNECLDNGAFDRSRPAEQGWRQTYTRARESAAVVRVSLKAGSIPYPPAPLRAEPAAEAAYASTGFQSSRLAL